MLDEFKKFALKGNVIDLAVGIIIGAAFNGVVNSLVNDVVTPPLGLLTHKVNFANLYINLSGKHYLSLAAAKAADAPTINYGLFVNALINFVIVSLAVFLLIRQVNRLGGKDKKKLEPTEKDCPFCFTAIPAKATRCPNCTSELNKAVSL